MWRVKRNSHAFEEPAKVNMASESPLLSISECVRVDERADGGFLGESCLSL